MKLLAKDRNLRPASAQEVALAIHAIESDPTMLLTNAERVVRGERTAPPTPPPNKRRRKLPWIAAAVLLGAILVMGVVITLRTKHGTLVVNLPEAERAVGDAAYIESLESAVRINPRLWKVHASLVQHYRQKGDRKKAEYHQKRAAP